MAADYYRKSGQIPAFGDWENANDLPITQYFECARQAGLLRCSCSGECGGSYMNNAAAYWGGAAGGGDLYGVGFEKPLPRRDYAAVPQRKARGNNKGRQYYPKSQKKQVKVGELMGQPRDDHEQKKQYPRPSTNSANNLVSHKPSINVKPVDEDLYKIPSQLLENSKRKKMLGFFSRCMVPPCAA